MVKGVIWGRPKKTIERYAKEDLCRFGEIREELFYKAPRGRLRKAKAVRTSEKIRESGLPKKVKKWLYIPMLEGPENPLQAYRAYVISKRL